MTQVRTGATNRKKFPVWKKLLKKVAYLIFLGVTVLLLLEGIYRLQVIEFYGPTLRALNPDVKQNPSLSNDTAVLLIGDSFSARPNSYVDQLRLAHPDWYLLNAAIPGTGIRQQELILDKRLRNLEPDILIYQIYVGNDLSDIMHPWSSDSLSPVRNLYWWLSDRLLILPFINQQLALVKYGRMDTSRTRTRPLSFEVDTYSPRVKLYLKADPTFIQQSVLLQGVKQKAYAIWKEKMEKMLDRLPAKTQIHLLIIPHCSQVSENYLQQYLELGAELSPAIQATQYPLLQQIGKDFPQLHISNPLPYFQETAHPDSLFYQHDPHLSDAGQRVLSRFFLEQLSQAKTNKTKAIPTHPMWMN